MACPPTPPEDLTRLLNEAETPPNELFRAHYGELRRLAGALMRSERAGHSLQATELVHAAFLRLVDRARIDEQGTVFFKACVARECRRVLVEHARRHAAQRRGGDRDRQPLLASEVTDGKGGVPLVELHDLIEELYARNAAVARVVDLRVFGGLTIDETAAALEIAPRTVVKYWSFAQSWLKRELAP